jgi:hypothetical protein
MTACVCSRCGRSSSTAAPGEVCGDLTAKGNPCHGTFRSSTASLHLCVCRGRLLAWLWAGGVRRVSA